MKKTFRSAISVILMAVFVMSLVPVVSFASAETHPGMIDDSISFKPSSTESGWQRYDVIENEYLGGKGEPYSLWGDSAGAPRREISVASAGGSQDVVEMSLYIPSNSQGMSFDMGVYSYPSGYKSLPLLVKSDGIYTNFSSGPKKIVTLEADKWNNIAFVSPEPYDDSAASNSMAVEIYVNGVLKKSHNNNYSVSGFRHLRLNALGGTSALDPVMYVDNVRIYSGEYTPEYDLVDSIAYTGGIEDDKIFIKDAITVAQLKEGITKKDDTTIRVYESQISTQPLGDNEIVKEGYTVVAAAKNGADMERSYNYYTVEKFVKSYPDINDGSNTGLNALKKKSGATGTQTFESLTGNFGGKEDDTYILWCDSDGTYTRQIPLNCSGGQDTLEMSFLIPSGSNGFSIGQHISNTAGSGATGVTLWFKPTGIYAGWYETSAAKIFSLETDKWYSFALVTPTPYSDGSEPGIDKTILYLNGESQSVTTSNTKTGFRYLNVKCAANGSLVPAIYLDNIRTHSDTYEPEYDVIDEISYIGGIQDGTLLTSGDLTVGELKSGITKKEDTVIRVYESAAFTQPLSDDAPVKDNYIVVAAAKNGSEMERSYSYYRTGKYIHRYPGINAGTTVFNPSSQKPDYQRMESVNGYLGGKGGEDYLLLADSSGASTRELLLTDASGKQDVLEMSVYIPSGSKGMSLSLYFTNLNSKSVSLPLLIREDGIYTNFSAGPSRFIALEPDRWYSLAFVTPEPYVDSAAENSMAVKTYVNGVLADTRNVTYTKSGFRNKIFVSSYGDSTDEPQAYLDNIRVYSGEYAPEYDTLDAIDYADGVIDDQIIMKERVTVAQLKEGITKKEDTEIRVYKTLTSDKYLSDDEYVEDGYTVVAAAKNGSEMERSYNYYTAGKYVYKYNGINKGTTVLSNKSGTASSFGTMQSVKGNLGGKENDDYLVWCNSDGANQRVIPITDATGTQDVLEMSFYIPSNSNGFSIGQFLSNTANSGACGFSLWFKPSGFYTRWSSGENWQCALEPDKWHTFAMVTPTPYVDGTEAGSDRVTVYLDGKKMEFTTNATKTGFRYLNLGCFANGDMRPAVYFDNIRTHSEAYAPQYDVPDDITFTGFECTDKVITVKAPVTVGQLKESINKNEDTFIRVYENLSSTDILSDDTIIENGYVVVAAAKNGSEMERTYNYYTVDRIRYEVSTQTLVNGEASNVFDDDDTLYISADFTNCTTSDTFSMTMYTAQYVNGKLVDIWTDSDTAAVGETKTLTCDFAGMTNRESSDIKVMIADDNLSMFVAPVTMHHNRKDTKATLYLMGDSIVQTYVNEAYPIQGWGCYLGDYLNDNITVENRGRSGWTTDHYLYPDGIYTKENGILPVGTELLNTKGSKKIVGASDRFRTWESIKSTLKAGDYIMIALGINDSGSGNVPAERYAENIETIYSEATSMGAKVILMTPSITGRDWNDTAGFRQEYLPRGEQCMEIAARHNGVCLPFGAELIKTYDAMYNEYMAENPDATNVEGKNYVRNYFHLYGASSTNPPPGWEDFGSKTTDDDMHYNFVGAKKAASVIAKLLAESDSPLGDYVEMPQ